MKHRRLTGIVIILMSCILFTSCQTLMDILVPKASPQQVADIIDKANKIKFKSPKKLWKSNKKIVKLKKGQWVTTLTRYKDSSSDVVLTTTKIISVKGSTVVIETERYSAVDNGVRSITQMTIENFPKNGKIGSTQSDYEKNFKNVKITKIINRQGDEPASEVPQQALAMSQNLAQTISVGAIRTGDLKSTSYKSDYIKSSRCYEYDFNVAVMGMTVTGTVTAHASVPINGLVKLENDQMTEEMIAFGNSGATSSL